MPLSFAGSGQGIECGLVKSINALMEHVHSLYCDSRQPASFSMSLLKAVALEWTSTSVKQGTRSQLTFCCLTCEKYLHRTNHRIIEVGRDLQIIQGPALHPLNHKSLPWSCWLWGGGWDPVGSGCVHPVPTTLLSSGYSRQRLLYPKTLHCSLSSTDSPTARARSTSSTLPTARLQWNTLIKNVMQAHLNPVLKNQGREIPLVALTWGQCLLLALWAVWHISPVG